MSQAPQTHTSPPPGPAAPPTAHQSAVAAIAEKLEALRAAVAAKLDEDQLAALQAAVVELASLAGHPPGLSQPVPTPPPPPAAPNPPAQHQAQHATKDH